MTRGHLLPLPTSADMNQAAHPGGGTVVTEASGEGLVEDLFEAHLRHLDVATKSAVATRLADVATAVEGMGLTRAAEAVDSILSFAAGPEALQPTGPDITSINNLVAKLKQMVDNVSDRDIENFHAGELHKELRSDIYALSDMVTSNKFDTAAVQAGMLEQKLLRLDLRGEVAESFGGGDALWGWATSDKVGTAKAFLLGVSMLKRYLNDAAKWGLRGAGQQGLARMQSPTGTPEEQKALETFSSQVIAMANEYDDLDARTEDWKSEMSPQNYQKLYSEFLHDIPKLGYLNRLAGLRDRLEKGQIRASQIPSYKPVIDGLGSILADFRRKVEAIDARLLGSTPGFQGGQ